MVAERAGPESGGAGLKSRASSSPRRRRSGYIITIDISKGSGAAEWAPPCWRKPSGGWRRWSAYIELETATTNEAAVAFWQRHGYRPTGCFRAIIWAASTPTMFKKLAPAREAGNRMTLFHAVVLAVVQGLTEFLPVSSSAHLWFFPWALDGPTAAFPSTSRCTQARWPPWCSISLGTWIELVLNGFGVHYPASASQEQVPTNRRLFWLLVIGTIPGAIVGGSLRALHRGDLAQSWAHCRGDDRRGRADDRGGGDRRAEARSGKVEPGDSIVIGSAQALALFPGVSRSGITIVAGLWRKMTREAAARFSFLLSTPLIAGAAAEEIPQLLEHARSGGVDLTYVHST